MSTRDCKKKRSPNWTDSEANALLDLWKVNKKQLEGPKRNQYIFQEMSVEMAGYYCYRTAEEIRTKIDNMSKRFRYERTQEILKGTKSEWRYYWPVDDIIGLNPSYCVEYIKDNINKKAKEQAKEDNRATILMLKYPTKKEAEEIEENDGQSEDMEHDEPLTANSEMPSSSEAADESEIGNDKFLKDLFLEYKETKESLVENDKKILELLSNQNDLIKTQNELCQTQNAIFKTLLEKMA